MFSIAVVFVVLSSLEDKSQTIETVIFLHRGEMCYVGHIKFIFIEYSLV